MRTINHENAVFVLFFMALFIKQKAFYLESTPLLTCKHNSYFVLYIIRLSSYQNNCTSEVSQVATSMGHVPQRLTKDGTLK